MLENILIALAVLAAVSLLMGILLAVFTFFFKVEEDETFTKIRECLPSINCGACGYKGCDDYAKAIAEGKAKPNLCIPGAEMASGKIAEILGVEVEEPEDFVAFVHCNGHCEASPISLVYKGVKTCKAASTVFGGPKSCIYGCMGYGDCALACPSGAICIKDGIAHVDTTLCLGCGLCVTKCPKNIISLVPQETSAVVMCNSKDNGAVAKKACSNACIGCKKCEKTCPHGAITVQDNLARIDYTKCTGCKECTKVCPTGCLKEVFFEDLDFSRVDDIVPNEE